MTDAELVLAARDGDREAFAAIYERYADRIHDFATSVLHDRVEAADVTHDTFLLAAEHLRRLRDPAHLRSWLFAIARHEALRTARRRGRAELTEEISEVEPSGPESAHSPEVAERVEQTERVELVRDATEGLSERDRVVLDLHLRKGLDGRELADAIGTSEGNAWVMVHRVRERFERALGALLVARTGSGDCSSLASLLGDWDGRFSPRVRKRVARHVDDCEVCSATRSRMLSPATLLAAVPLAPAPAELRDRVLERVELVAHSHRLPRGWRDGYPPSMLREQRRRRFGAVGLLLVVILLAGLLVDEYRGREGSVPLVEDRLPVASEGDTAPTSTTSTSTTTTTLRAAGPGGVSPPAGTAPADDDQPTGTLATTTTTTTTTISTSPTTSSTTTTTIPDTEGPTIGTIAATPSEIWEDGGFAECQPTTSTVSVTVTDPSGVVSVTLAWSVGQVSGDTPMTPSGTTYSATVGPFGLDTIPGEDPQSQEWVTLTVTATDGAGNPSSRQSTAALLLKNCAVPF